MVDLDKRKLKQHDVRYDSERLYDVVITSSNKGFRLSDRAAHELIRNMKAKYWIRPYEEAIDEDWVEVYCEADATSHEIFTPGRFGGDPPAFKEVVIHFGKDPVLLEYGAEPLRVFFYIEFRGCVFKEPLGLFRKWFKDITMVRCEDHNRPHTGLPEHLESTVYEDDEAL